MIGFWKYWKAFEAILVFENFILLRIITKISAKHTQNHIAPDNFKLTLISETMSEVNSFIVNKLLFKLKFAYFDPFSLTSIFRVNKNNKHRSYLGITFELMITHV